MGDTLPVGCTRRGGYATHLSFQLPGRTGSFVIAAKNEFSRCAHLLFRACPPCTRLSFCCQALFVGVGQPVHGRDRKGLVPCLSFDLPTLYQTFRRLSSTFCGLPLLHVRPRTAHPAEISSPVLSYDPPGEGLLSQRFSARSRLLTGQAQYSKRAPICQQFFEKILCPLRIHLYSNHFIRQFALCSVLIFVQF